MRHFSHLPMLGALLSSLAALAIAPAATAQINPSAGSRESFQKGSSQIQAQLREFDFQDSQFEQVPGNTGTPGVTPDAAPNPAFYAEARRLIQAQINLVSRTRRAMTAVDPNAIRAVDGQIVLHGTRVNRFIGENYPVVQPNCNGTSSIASVAAQDLIACNLLTNSKAFDQLQPRLFSRLNMLSGISEVNRLPLVSGERVVNNAGVPLFEKGSFKNPSPTIVTRAPDIPRKEVGVLGRPVKSALGDYQAPISPAIAAPDDVLQSLEQIEIRIDQSRGALPLNAQTFNTGGRRLSPVLGGGGAPAAQQVAPSPIATQPTIAAEQTVVSLPVADRSAAPASLGFTPLPTQSVTPAAPVASGSTTSAPNTASSLPAAVSLPAVSRPATSLPAASLPVANRPAVSLSAAAPRSVGFSNPEVLLAAADAAAYDVNPTDRIQHQKFLTNPHTGITQVLTRREHEPDPNYLRNRLDPTPAERYPTAILVEPTDPPLPQLDGELQGRLAPFDTQRYPFVPLEETSFRPRLAMQIDGGEFNLMTSGLDYGFMLDMGTLNNLDLNTISAGLPKEQLNLRDDLRDYFLNYRAPQNLDQLMVDRRRFLSGKMGPNNLPSLLSPDSKIEVGHTYLLRTLQFQVPDAISKGTPISYSQRRNLERTLDMPAKDLLVVFRPIKSRENGTYTVLWRVLGEFPEPNITDLDRYANYDGGIIGQGIQGIRR